MYDINLKNVKKGKTLFLIFFVIGLLTLIIPTALIYFQNESVKRLDSSVMSTKMDVESYLNEDGNRMYEAVYTYEVNGIEYKCDSNVSSSFIPSEKNVNIYYDSNKPSFCMTEGSKNATPFIYLFYLIPLVFILIGFFGLKSNKKRIKSIMDLNNKGKLVKNLPYRLERTGTVINNRPVLRPGVDYKLPNGSIVTLYGDGRYDFKESDEDGMVDIIIDEQNPSNYYIDFEINRLSGNREEDYYKPEVTNQADPFKTNF